MSTPIDNMPQTPDPQHNGDTADDKKNNKKLLAALISVIIVIALLVVFFINRGGEDGDEDTSAQTGETTTSHTPDETPPAITASERPTTQESQTRDPDSPPSTDDPDYGMIEEGFGHRYDRNGNRILSTNPDAPEYDDGYLPKKEPITDPVETGVRAEGLYEGDDMRDAGYDRLDQSVASVTGLSNLLAMSMMSPRIAEGGGYEESIMSVINQYGTDHAKEYGFRPWYVEGEHTDSWESAVLRGGGQIIANTNASNIEHEWINNSTVKTTHTVEQTSRVGGVNTPMGKQKVSLYMKMIDGKWYVDAYQFESGYPTFY